MTLDFEIVAEGLAFPEGPVWMKDGSLIFVEIAAGKITRLAPDGSLRTVAEPGGGPNGLAVGPDGALYCCNNGGFAWTDQDGMLIPGMAAADYEAGRLERIDIETGEVIRLFDSIDGHALSGPNDLVFDADGGFWFTDLGKVRSYGHDHGGLYYARPDTSLVRRAAFGPNMNGVGLSPDGRTVYAALTNDRQIIAMDVTGPGAVGAPALAGFPGRVVHGWAGRTLLDSLAVDAEGHVCVATLLETPGIASVDPASGAITHYDFPDLLTTNICFGGADMRDAWICLSATGRIAKVRWPRAGLELAHYA
ncbi:SMP-30/gluconolactonase/LRE family protein [Pacificimonas flava]|uniref:Putative gluconolactonase n=1 Tax=Pacificimonas flava TaxID=1234595 RepID=M2T7A7_9SPHN|nr:putative gluconolactonase [Pacificimonas flava]MBB5281238.1 gluconolactonase [Pacificimonas flava]